MMKSILDSIFILALLIFSTSHILSCRESNKAEKFKDDTSTERSKAGQIYHLTEVEGMEHLDEIKQSVLTPEDWRTRANAIQSHILKATDLDPLPDKCPLNPIYGAIRKYDGYRVQNVAFESLPGVYVTGSLYSPLKPTKKPKSTWPLAKQRKLWPIQTGCTEPMCLYGTYGSSSFFL